jgi:putative transposase
MNIRRYYIPGTAVFITQVVQDREPIFRNENHVELLREILHNVKKIHPFVMLAYVFLSDHFHVIIQPTGECNFSDIMHSLKPNFTKEYNSPYAVASSLPHIRTGINPRAILTKPPTVAEPAKQAS